MSSNPIIELVTVKDWVRWGASEFQRAGIFFGHGTDNAWDEAIVLVLWATSQPWERLEQIWDARLDLQERSSIVELFQRRIATRQPAAYLTGEGWFGGLKFKVTPDVLVPRSPIAELALANFQPWLQESPQTILDLCTGSGCIGLLCAKVFDDSTVDLSDISAPALKVAQHNILAHKLEDRVQAIESDLFCASHFEQQRYDLIVSNPPYVDAEDFASMPAEYHAEPELGLASGIDGLDFTRRLLREAVDHLNPGGLLVVEVGNSWESLEQAFPQVEFLWPEFENGGHGVFVLSEQQLKKYSAVLGAND
jgi:[LSU ribosomal protein L3P]-glutamine N5-methyltransferase (EC 2.1.1.-)